MGFVTEIEAAIKSGFDGFEQYIVHALQNNKDYLQQTLCAGHGVIVGGESPLWADSNRSTSCEQGCPS
jgi:hypothetical protein